MPYSDNLYSIDSDDEFPDLEPLADHGAYPVPPPPQQTQPLASPETGSQEDDQDPDHALSPADGNFPAVHATVTSSQTTGTSSHVPHVPNVLVRDPSLEQGSTAESKAREARQERQAADNSNIDSPGPAADTSTSPVVPSDDHSPSRATSPRSSSAYTPTSPTSSRATHYQPSTAGAYSAYAPSASSHSTSHVPRRSIYTPSSPFLPREAPPAYTPSPTVTSTYTASTSPTSPTASSQGQPDFSRNYQTFSQPGMGRPDETRGLLAEPESMGGPAGDDFVMVTPTWRDRVRRRVPYLNWRNCRYAAVCLVLLLVTTGFLVSSITSVKDDLKPKDPSDADPPSKAPVLEPPHMDYPPYDGDLPWSEDDHCSGKPTERVEFAFPVTYGRGHSFSLVQDIAEPDNAPPYDTHDIHVSGDVVVRRTGQGTPGPSVSVQLLKNDDAIHVTADWDRDAQALHLSVPRRLPGLDSVTWPCVSIRVTVWVPGDAVLDSLSIDNVHLGIRLMDNLALVVARYSKLTSVVGPIVAATDGTDKADNLVEDSAPDYFKLDSRVIEVKSTSAPITGYWPLYDYLGLSNIAGTIKVRVSPREEKKGAPKPATLYVKSLSGNIEVWEPVDKAQSALSSASSTDLVEPASPSAEKYIPPRDYRANIQSTSGTIKAAVAFSSACRIHSTSGSTLVELLPVLDVDASDAASNLETSTTSGTTKLEVLEPLWIGEDGKGYLPLPAPPSAPSDPTPPSLPSLPSPPSPPSPPRAPRPREDDEVVPIGPIGDSDPYRSLPLPPTLLPPTSATSLSRRDVVVVSKPPPALRCLQSRHASTSAEMRVTYPASWEGELDLGTVSGSLRVQGDGVKVIRDGKDWPGINRHLVARKGSGGGSAAGLKTTSGSIRVFVGE